MKPAIRPKTIQAMIPMKDLSWLNSVEADTLSGHEPHYLLPRRKSTVRGKIIHHIRKHAGEFGDDLIARQPGPARQIIDNVAAERHGNLVGTDVLVLAGADPGVDHIAQSLLLELLDEAAEPVEDAAGRRVRRRLRRLIGQLGHLRRGLLLLPAKIARSKQRKQSDDQGFRDVAAGHRGAAFRPEDILRHFDLLFSKLHKTPRPAVLCTIARKAGMPLGLKAMFCRFKHRSAKLNKQEQAQMETRMSRIL